MRSAIGRAGWPRWVRRERRTRCWKYLIVHAAMSVRLLSRCSGSIQWPELILKGRVLSAEIEYSRFQFLVNGLEYPRAEYARQRSCDPGMSDAVRNIREPSTLGGDLAIPVSQMRCLESRVRSTETEYSRSRDLCWISRKSDSELVSRLWSLGLACSSCGPAGLCRPITAEKASN